MSKSGSRSPLHKEKDIYGQKKSSSRWSSGLETVKPKSPKQKLHYKRYEKVDACKHSRHCSNKRQSSSDRESSSSSTDEISRSPDSCSSRDLGNSRKTPMSGVSSILKSVTNHDENHTTSTRNNRDKPEPSTIILLRGLTKDVTESDIYKDVVSCNFMPMDIRLIRRKLTGTPRGFAFVQFDTLNEAKQYMDIKKGYVQLGDKCSAVMQYSVDHRTREKFLPTEDWFCIKCSTKNFKKRTSCYTCQTSKSESSFGGPGSDEVCSSPTKTLMLRNLDALTTEERVLTFLNLRIPELIKLIVAVRIGRDPITSLSLGVCYLSTRSSMDSLAITFALSKAIPLVIDNKPVVLSYCKRSMDVINEFVNPVMKAEESTQVFAHTAARYYARSPSEYMQYLEYYKNYYQGQGAITGAPVVTNVGYNSQNATNLAHVTSYDSKYVDANSGTTTSSFNLNWNSKRKPVQMHWKKQKVTVTRACDLEHVTCNENDNRPEILQQSVIVMTSSSEELAEKREKGCDSRIENFWSDELKRKDEENAAANQITLATAVDGSVSNNNDKVFGQEWLDLTHKVCNLCKRRFVTCEMLFEHAKHSELHKCNFKVKEVNKNFDKHITRLLQGQ